MASLCSSGFDLDPIEFPSLANVFGPVRDCFRFELIESIEVDESLILEVNSVTTQAATPWAGWRVALAQTIVIAVTVVVVAWVAYTNLESKLDASRTETSQQILRLTDKTDAGFISLDAKIGAVGNKVSDLGMSLTKEIGDLRVRQAIIESEPK